MDKRKVMKIFVIDGTNSRFIDVRKDYVNLFKNNLTYVFDWQITQPRIIRWIASGMIPISPEYRPIWWLLYDYMGQPYKDLDQWLYELQIAAHKQPLDKLSTAEMAKYDNLSVFDENKVSDDLEK